MRVSVDNSVYALSIFSNAFAAPLRGGAVHAQMTYDKYIVRAVLACLVDILLQLLVQLITGFILAEAVNILALLILEEGRRGGCQAFRCARTHKGYLGILILHNFVARQNLLIVACINKICTVVACTLQRHQLHEAVHAVVKFMVTGNAEVIAQIIHNIDNSQATGQLADRCTLNSIACIHQRYVRRSCQSILFNLRQAVKADIIINTAMYIVSVQNNNVMLQCPRHQRSGNSHRRSHQKQRCFFQEFFHIHHFLPSLYLHYTLKKAKAPYPKG